MPPENTKKNKVFLVFPGDIKWGTLTFKLPEKIKEISVALNLKKKNKIKETKRKQKLFFSPK